MKDLSNLKHTFTKKQRDFCLETMKYNRTEKEYLKHLEDAFFQFDDEREEYETAFFVAMFLLEKIINELDLDVRPLFSKKQEKLFKQLYVFYRDNDYILWNKEHDGLVDLSEEENKQEVVI